MFRKIWIVVFMLLLPFGAAGCGLFYDNDAPTPTPPASPTPVVDEVVLKLREELDRNPEKLAERLASADSVEAVDMGLAHVDGKGTRSIVKVGETITNCEEPGEDVPTRCIRIVGTPYWACNGQILRDCPECPIPTPATAVPPTGVPPTATQTPPTGVPPTSTVPPTAVPPTGVPPTATTVPPTGVPPTATQVNPPTATWTPKPVPTNEPPPKGTVCADCIDPYQVDADLGVHNGAFVPEGRECAFEHRPGEKKIDIMKCPPEYFCTVDNDEGFFVYEGRNGLVIHNVWGATVRWRPWVGYSGETLARVFEGEYCHALARAPRWAEGKELRAIDASGAEQFFPTPSAERCAIRNAP